MKKLTPKQQEIAQKLKPLVEQILNEANALSPRNQQIANDILSKLTEIETMVGRRSTGDSQLDAAIGGVRSIRLKLRQYIGTTVSSIGR
jgi:hypothetical protein